MKSTRTSARGMSLLWATVSLTALTGFAMLAIDVGRWQLCKSELRRASDAAARAGASLVATSGSSARLAATDIAKKNLVDGRALVDKEIDVTVGYWDTTTRVFKTTIPAGRTANAVKVVTSRTAAKGSPVPTVFAQLFGARPLDAQAEAIAMWTEGVNVNHVVDGRVNPFLSGMPNGTVVSKGNPHNNPDKLGTNVPSIAAVGMPIIAGQQLSFDSIDGTVQHDPNLAYYSPDGNLSSIGHNHNPTNGDMNGTSYYDESGIADARIPINALVGVFLSDAAPNTTAAPGENLDFKTGQSRDFATLKPQLKQVFFIGDGLRNDGLTQQRFEAPAGATRLYLATWDFYEWNNNAGTRTIKVMRPGSVSLVR